MMNDVVDYGSCCECGACVVACPHNVIEYIDGKPKQTAKSSAPFDFCGVSEGAGCDVCATVCPRLWPREEHLKDAVFEEDRPFEDIFGVFRNIFVARTKKPEIAKKIIEEHGGIVWLENNPDSCGACAIIRLPAVMQAKNEELKSIYNRQVL